MGLGADQYLGQLQALLPPGRALTREPDATLTQLLAALSEEFARIDNRAADLIEEADPQTTVDLLSDWERVFGLPETCLADVQQTTAQRQDALASKMTAIDDLTPQFYIDTAARLGYAITITEYSAHTCEKSCEDAINDEVWAFAWTVNAALNTIVETTCEGACEDPLRIWGNDSLECFIKRQKPAHTAVLFAYT